MATKTHVKRIPNISHGIDLKPYKTIRLAVSGDVMVNRLEKEIIDTTEFQRLRSIKQLGTTYLVYPTALHTRFDHSVGTLNMANEMVVAIRENKHNSEEERLITSEQEQLLRLFALLHDITHIPFGHTIEDEFSILPRHDEDNSRKEHFVGEDSKIGRIIIDSLGKDFYKRFVKIFAAGKDNISNLGDDAFIYDIVNNTVCADLLDYLRRDCHFCNIVLDMDYRFLKYLYLQKEKGEKRLVVRLWKEESATPRRDVLSELIRLLDNRYILGERVYFHHSKLITGAMIAASVRRALDLDELDPNKLIHIGDETLLDILEGSEEPSVSKLVTALRSRKLWKRVYRRNRQTVEEEQTRARDINVWERTMERWWLNSIQRTKDENWVVDTLGLESADFLIYCTDQKMAMKLADMKVFWNGNLRPLRECTDDPIVADRLSLILRSHANLWAINAFLNPDHIEKKNIVENACQYLFTFDNSQKQRYGKLFYDEVVDEITRVDGTAGEMSHDEYVKRAKRAIELITEDHDTRLEGNMVKNIIRDTFSNNFS